jgi:hypothetical protein
MHQAVFYKTEVDAFVHENSPCRHSRRLRLQSSIFVRLIMLPMKSVILILSTLRGIISQSSSGDSDPCDYCAFDECSAPQNFLYVCCNDGSYHACLDGSITCVWASSTDVGCKPGSYLCGPGCDPDNLPFIPLNEGGAGNGTVSICSLG